MEDFHQRKRYLVLQHQGIFRKLVFYPKKSPLKIIRINSGTKSETKTQLFVTYKITLHPFQVIFFMTLQTMSGIKRPMSLN